MSVIASQIDPRSPDFQASYLGAVRARFPAMSDLEARTLLAHFGIQGDMALRRVGTLSGGQKSRVALAIITESVPNPIYMDEPTNQTYDE